MTAPHILATRHDDAVDRIEAHAKSLGDEHPDIVDAAERVREARGPDEEHSRVFRLEAIADLMERIDELTAGQKADPLEEKNKEELYGLGRDEGADVKRSDNKADLLMKIRQNRA